RELAEPLDGAVGGLGEDAALGGEARAVRSHDLHLRRHPGALFRLGAEHRLERCIYLRRGEAAGGDVGFREVEQLFADARSHAAIMASGRWWRNGRAAPAAARAPPPAPAPAP